MKSLLTVIVVLCSQILISQEYSFMFDGIVRSYVVHVPDEINRETPLPIVLNLHGAGSNAIEQQFYSEMDSIATLEKFIVVYPDGINGSWNILSDLGTNDVGFISALIDTMAANYNIDLKRVYAAGMSMGGFMSYRLACQLNNKLAAIGSVAGVLAYPGCSPERPVPVCHFHGTADSSVLFDLAPNTIAYWSGMNECSDTSNTDLPDIDPEDSSTVTLIKHTRCNDKVEVLFYTINGGGHSWPGASYYIDITNQDIHASVELWKFFSNYTLPDYSGMEHDGFAKSRLTIYPNPMVQSATIELPHEKPGSWTLRIYDLSGKVVHKQKIETESNIALKRMGLKAGIYLVELRSKKMVLREKLLVR